MSIIFSLSLTIEAAVAVATLLSSSNRSTMSFDTIAYINIYDT